uniref:G patch domain-containing protein 4 n=1 Tax=Anopheles farauti TaxID=69004 RepID=A0A182QUC2_9DIPT
MDFARNILEKYGWKDGEGLGKNSDGMKEPIKASLKFSKIGFGAETVDSGNNWWERVYNDASSNIEVQSDGSNHGKVKLRQLDTNAVEITTKGYSVNKLKRRNGMENGASKYGNVFLKASTLSGTTGREEEEANHVRTEDVEFTSIKTLTDEELFAACGGRTAHKGARHGLRLNGKLSRIDEQNNKLLQELESKSFEAVIKSNEWKVQLSKNGRKKSKKQVRNEQRWIEHGSTEAGDDEVKDMVHHADYVVSKNKKKKKRQQQTDHELANNISSMFADLPEEDCVEKPEPEQPKSKHKSKSSSKKKRSLDDELDLISEKIRKLDHSSVTIKKKDKKKKNKLKEAMNNVDDDTPKLDPAAKYRKDYRSDMKKNNRLLKKTVPHETPPENLINKPIRVLRSESSDEEEEDIVQRVNEEQERYWRKMRAAVPKINIIEPTEDDCLMLGQSLKESHKNNVKRVGNRTSGGNRKKNKKKHRQVAQLADSLSKKL